MMYNKVTLIGQLADLPEKLYDPDGNVVVCMQLKVSPPSDAPPTYWGVTYDLRTPQWTVGEETFMVICRAPLLIERCLQSLHKDDLVCVEGRLVLTQLLNGEDLLYLAEILASDVILLTEHADKRSQEE
ncbi:MAG TPA: single-stranded DNA-binding protein [Ktedonobacteraceae bacterium]|nr:single-stranded DNA-binding protein [Ktedonobacteraceae bacterium]